MVDSEGCISEGEPCGSANFYNLITQGGGSSTPGCSAANSAREASGWPPPSFFSGPACGVNLNFYKDGNTFTYYQSGGSGQQLGVCVPNESRLIVCPADDGLGIITVQGEYTCSNYQQVVNGINPCQS
jgi:hypothetical protein